MSARLIHFIFWLLSLSLCVSNSSLLRECSCINVHSKSKFNGDFVAVAARRWEFFVEHILGSKQSLFWTQHLKIRKQFDTVFKQAFDNEFWDRSASRCFRGAQNRAHRALLATACWLWYKELSLAPVRVKSFPARGSWSLCQRRTCSQVQK